jgi:hypothetical protein
MVYRLLLYLDLDLMRLDHEHEARSIEAYQAKHYILSSPPLLPENSDPHSDYSYVPIDDTFLVGETAFISHDSLSSDGTGYAGFT